MSNIPISSLPLATSLDGSESVPIVQGGTTKRTTLSNIRSNAPIPASAVLFTQDGTGAVQVTLDSLLRKTVVTPEMFGAVGDGVTDDTAAIVRLATYIRSIPPAGVQLDLKPGAEYFIWPNSAGAPLPARGIDLTGVVGLTVNFNGAKFTTNNLFTTATTSTVFFLDHTQDLIVNDPWYVQTGKTTLDSGNGGGLIFGQTSSAPWNRNIIVNNPKQFGGLHGIQFVGYVGGVGIPIDNHVENIEINNGYFDTVYYPLAFAWAGDNVRATIKANNCGRTYFPYGVSHHDVTILSNGGGPFNDLNIKAYGMPQLPPRKNTTSGIHVRYKNAGRINATASESLCSLEMAQNPQGVTLPTVTGAANNGSGAIRLTTSSLAAAAMATGQTWYANAVGGVPNATGKWVVTVVDNTHVDLQGSTFAGAYTSGGYMRVPAELSDIHIEFDVDNTSNQQPPAVLTYKQTADGLAETVACGYTLDNIEITGKLRNYNYGKNAIDLFTNTGGYPGFSIGTWTGETVRNIILRDLVVEGTNSGITLDNTVPVNLIIENVVTTTTTVPWTFSVLNSDTRIINANGTGIVISRSVVPSAAVTNQFVTGIDAFGGLTRAQPSLSNLSGLGTGVAAALGTNVGSAGAPVLFNGAGGTPASLTLTNATGLPVGSLTGRAALTKTDDTNVTLTLGGTPTTALLAASSLTLGWTGQLGLTRGGTAASLTASNGGIFYSTASAGAILAGTATARQMLQSGATAAPAWSTATWPATTTVNRLLWSSAANVISDLATANSSVLVTDGSGVPSLSTTLPNINIGTPTGGVGTNITGLPISGGLLGTIKPEGRLTLVSGTPVMSSTVTAQTTVYYTPDVGTNVPVYNGTSFVPTAFAEVSQATTDATKSPAAVANNSNYDLFCWIDSGTNRCTRGPAWTGDNTRGTGAGTSELQRVNGILTNKVAITNGPAANRGTYVGSIRSNGTATIDFQFGALASGGTAGSFGVWNMFNRVTVASMSQDTTDSYNVIAIGIANSSTGMRTSFVVGQIEDGFSSNYNVTAVAGALGAAQAGVSFNSTTAFSGSIGYLSASNTGNMAGFLNALPLLGFNYTSAMEGVSAGTSAFKGDNGDATHIQNGHAFMGRL